MTPPAPGSDGRLEALLRQVVAARGAKLERHPDADEWVDYCLHALGPDDQERLADHLALCPECAHLVLDLKAITKPPPAGPAEPPADLAAQWARLASRAARHPRADAAARVRPRTWALAASLVVSAGLLAWALSLRRDLERERQPRADVALADLTPVARGGERTLQTPAEAVIPAGVGRVVLLLNLGDLRTFPRYRVELVAPAGRRLWTSRDVRRAEDGTFLLDVPAAALPAPGLYRVLVEGVGDAGPVRLAEYELRVARQGPPRSPR